MTAANSRFFDKRDFLAMYAFSLVMVSVVWLGDEASAAQPEQRAFVLAHRRTGNLGLRSFGAWAGGALLIFSDATSSS